MPVLVDGCGSASKSMALTKSIGDWIQEELKTQKEESVRREVTRVLNRKIELLVCHWLFDLSCANFIIVSKCARSSAVLCNVSSIVCVQFLLLV